MALIKTDRKNIQKCSYRLLKLDYRK